MAENYRSKQFRDVARYAHQRPDGTILYFESDGKTAHAGELPANAGYDPAALEAQGFVFLNKDAYARTQRSLDPIARAEDADADQLAAAFDASMGQQPNGGDMNGQGGDADILQDLLDQKMAEQGRRPQANAQQGGDVDSEVLALFQQYMDEGRLPELFQPFQQEQNVLSQQMELAEGLRQSGPQRSTPTGALFGGLAKAAGNIGAAALQQKGLAGQTALGKRQQMDASGRTRAILRAAMKRLGIDPDTGLRDDAELTQLFSGR